MLEKNRVNTLCQQKIPQRLAWVEPGRHSMAEGGGYHLTVSSDHRRYVFCYPKYASWCRYHITLQKGLQFHFSNISQTAEKTQFQKKKWAHYCAISRVI